MATPDPEIVSWLRILIAFIVVSGLLSLLALTLKYVSLKGFSLPGRVPTAKRLEVVESLALDVKRRLVIVRQDDREHLLLLGLNQDIVVEPNLRPSAPIPTKNAP